ncbi:MAG: lysophospholipid acyltransferase family protein [Desulfuromonadaceae bacterium]
MNRSSDPHTHPRGWRRFKGNATVVLMNLWCYPALILWTLLGLLLFPVVFGVGLVFLRMPADRLMRLLVWIYGRGWVMLMSPFVRFRREHMDRIAVGEPCVFVVNHLSFFDTYCMALLPGYDITFAVRSWPFKMFWYSAFMRLARYLDVEGSTWQETISNCRSTFAAGGTVLFFPEGHRSRDGELQRFYTGAFKVAVAAQVPLVPLCIEGTDRLLPPGRKWFRPCTIRLRALEPIETQDYSDTDGHILLRKQVKERIAETLAAMRAQNSQ